jgi:hypothetical protein
VKKAVFRTDPNKGGFITSFITPIHAKRRPSFTVLDAMMIMALVAGIIIGMRLLVAR